MELNWNSYQAQAKTELILAEDFVDAINALFKLQFHGNRSAVYLVSPNAGSVSSIAFWKNALEHSPRFANPGIFPWTLANATAGCIARTFSITGPNYTIVEKDIDLNELIAMYENDKQKYKLLNALLVIWDISISGDEITVNTNWSVIA